MHGATARLSTVLLAGALSAAAATTPLEDLSLSGLEQRLGEIDSELAQLANYSLRGGIGSIGYRSQAHDDTGDNPEWIEIDFGATVPLDEVILVPAIRRDTKNGFQADAFPWRFRLLAGNDGDRDGRVIAEYDREAGTLAGIAPFIIPCNGIEASWIRVEANQLSLRAFDEQYVFQLSEVLAFSGTENVALHRPVRTSSSSPGIIPGWNVRFLVDGFMPYLMDAAEGSKSVAYLTPGNIDPQASLTIDLGRTYPLSRIHLHAVDQSDTLPQAFAGDFGIPKQMTIEGANQPDFSDASLLITLHPQTIYDTGPIIMRTFPEANCRYIRLKVVEPYETSLYGKLSSQWGFAEIEVFSRGRNIALGKPTSTSFEQVTPGRPISNLTDGLNMYGNILPIRDWMNQLARRHELETERPLVAEELTQRYARQKANLKRMVGLTFLLALGVVAIVLVDRIIRQRAIYRTRKRIAADLHDELGADLHAIGLLSDLAQAARAAPEKLDGLLQRMRALTERSGKAARYCTNMLEAKGLYGDLVRDMRHTSARIMADLEHEIEVEGEAVLEKLKPQTRIDLFLFYNECLINIIRHSGATRAHTMLAATHGEIRLTVTDNGHGLNGEVPASLKRRARLLGAQVEAGRSDPDGTHIRLKLKTSRFGILK